MLGARRVETLERVAESVRSPGRRVHTVATDVADPEQCQRLVDEAMAKFGRVDVLVNNAGMSPLYPSVAEVSEELWDKTIGVNLKGPFRLSALLGTEMCRPSPDGAVRGGVIINVSSTTSQRPSANEIIYGAAKAGVNNLTVSLARAFAPHVRVNCIVPGPFLTDISKAWDLEQFAERAKSAYALQRGGQPHEIVGAALFLASDASSYVTGTLVNVDGGPR